MNYAMLSAAARDERIVDLWEQGYGSDEIAEMVGLTERSVRSKISDMGLYDRKISEYWYRQTGIGDRWDATCKAIRKACGA